MVVPFRGSGDRTAGVDRERSAVAGAVAVPIVNPPVPEMMLPVPVVLTLPVKVRTAGTLIVAGFAAPVLVMPLFITSPVMVSAVLTVSMAPGLTVTVLEAGIAVPLFATSVPPLTIVWPL